MSAPVPPAPPDVSQRYVAFCDILGFSSRLREDFNITVRAYDEFLSFLTEQNLLMEVRWADRARERSSELSEER
jgi:hypothetical protein